MKTGLFFGSFNPIHIGHLIVAQHTLNFTDLEQLWFVVSPHSPFKSKTNLAPESDRLAMAQLALQNQKRLEATDFEFSLPRPSYTVDTLSAFRAQFAHEFVVVLGSDNLADFHKWKDHQDILAHHELYIYSRPGSATAELDDFAKVSFVSEAPLLHISSTYIRSCLAKGLPVHFLTPEVVIRYIEDNGLYNSDVSSR